MKKVLLTLVFILAVVPTLFAQDGRSIVRVRLSDNKPLMIAIDNKTYNDVSKVITVDNITAGRHKLKVFVPGASGRGRKTLVYQGEFNVDVGTYSYIIVDRYKGKVRITSGYRGNLDKEVNNSGRRNEYDEDREDGYHDRDRYDRDNDRYDNDRSMFSSRDMQTLEDRVQDRMHNTDKVKLMKSVLNDRTYTTEQVRTMLEWLSFDDSKLDFATWAYNNVVDKKNYWKLEDTFSFSSTKDKFSDYITARR